MDPQEMIKRRKHDERVKKTRETLERMRMKQQESESAKQNSQFGFLFYGGLSLAVAFLGFATYKIMYDSTWLSSSEEQGIQVRICWLDPVSKMEGLTVEFSLNECYIRDSKKDLMLLGMHVMIL